MSDQNHFLFRQYILGIIILLLILSTVLYNYIQYIYSVLVEMVCRWYSGVFHRRTCSFSSFCYTDISSVCNSDCNSGSNHNGETQSKYAFNILKLTLMVMLLMASSHCSYLLLQYC